MTDDVSYWVAAHLTGIFEIKDESNDLLTKGSRGAGLCIERGVKTTIQQSKCPKIEIFFNGVKQKNTEAAVTTSVLEILLPQQERSNLKITHDFEIPLSSGYGASAAGAVGTAFAINDYLGLGFSELKLLQVAHKAEVLNRSGLGDVIGLFQGGLELRLKEGAPGFGKTIPITSIDGWKVATIHFGPLSTFEVLSNPLTRKAVNNAGKGLISKLISRPRFENFIRLSAIFSEKANLWSPQLQKSVQSLPQTVVGAQIMLGEALFVFYREKGDLAQIKVPKAHINRENICQKTIVRRE